MEGPGDTIESSTSSTNYSPRKNASETEIKVENITRNWTVRNFSHCYQEYLENFIHLPRGEENLTWSVKIYPKGNGENNKEFVFLCLNRVVNDHGPPSSIGGKNKIGFKSKFILRNSDNKEIDLRIHPNPSHSDYVSYVKRDILFPQIMPSDSVIVTVEIAAAVDTVTTTVDEEMVCIDFENQLGDDYLRILQDAVLTDCVLQVGGHELPAHRAILSARSPVFRAMFTHTSTTESRDGVVKIDGLEFEVVREMVMFIYSGRNTVRSEIASDLLAAADRYRLEALKILCENTLMLEITVENACHHLVLASMYRAKRLQNRCIDFIKFNLTEITQTSGWEELIKRHPNLVTLIVRYVDQKNPACRSQANDLMNSP